MAPGPRGPDTFLDRRREHAAPEHLLEAVRMGKSRALVVHGEPGVGKTALLEYLVGRCRDTGWCAPRVSSPRRLLQPSGEHRVVGLVRGAMTNVRAGVNS